jgi:hypothetical protein
LTLGIRDTMPFTAHVIEGVLCPTCRELMDPAKVYPGVKSRLYVSKRCGVVWLLFGERLYPCADVSGLVLPGQM